MTHYNDSLLVLDKGYVRLISTSGTETDIVNAARASFDKSVDELGEKDISLLEFLVREKHMSPFRHVSMTFEVYAPLMVARQHWKYVVGSSFTSSQQAWNESSRRYVTEEPEFYRPYFWRSSPESRKQGSGKPIEESMGKHYTGLLDSLTQASMAFYDAAISDNIAPEMARLFLPAYGLYVRYRWTVSVDGLINFFEQRIADDAQWEIQQYAQAFHAYASERFPNVFDGR